MKKIGILCLALVMALGTVGVGYAAWTDTIYIQGTVNTGELDWEFEDASCLDITGKDWHCRDGFALPAPRSWMGDKDVGSTSVAITDPHTVTVTLTNVYPYYFTMVSVYAHNSGTIPLIIEKVIISSAYETYTLDDPPPPFFPIVGLDLTGEGIDDINIWWRNGLGTQMHPSEPSPEMSFWIHVRQPAPEGATLTFTLEIVAVQWNMYVAP